MSNGNRFLGRNLQFGKWVLPLYRTGDRARRTRLCASERRLQHSPSITRLIGLQQVFGLLLHDVAHRRATMDLVNI